MSTIFTEIIEGKRPGFIIFEDETHVAILDKYPIDTGHSLVIPKTPYEKITDMPKNEVAELFSLVPNIEYWVMYGQTEFCGRISQYMVDLTNLDDKCVGRLLPGIEAYIKSDSDGEGLSSEEGEIFIHSPSTCNNISELAEHLEIDGKNYRRSEKKS